MPAPICLIVNPAAGGGRAGRIAPEAQRLLGEHGLLVRREDTRDLQHARELGVAAARAGETVVALSGDGMIGVVADALREVPGALLGVLPGGRGNDLARVLGIGDDLRAGCAAVAGGIARALDLGEVVSEAQAASSGAPAAAVGFVGIASAGFDSDANRIANEAPAWLGGLVYAYGALRALASWRPARFEIELDPPGERHVFTGYSVAVANNRAYGGGMHVAPDALLDDGLLDVVMVERVSKLRFLANLPKVFKGVHVQLDTVRVFRAREVRVSADRAFTMYADGDPIGELPVRVSAVSAAVRVLVPAGETGARAFTHASPAPASPAPPLRQVMGEESAPAAPAPAAPAEGVADG